MDALLLGIVIALFKAVDCENIISYSNLSTEFNTANIEFDNIQTLIPVSNTNETMEVDVDLGLASVNSFDEIRGYLEISGFLHIKWINKAITASQYDVNVLFMSSSIWKPPLLLVNSIKSTTEIGNSTSKIRCNLKRWECEWKPWVVLRGGCTPDVRFYPFDTQICTYKIAAWGHTISELLLKPSRSAWNMQLLADNAEWVIESTSSNNLTRNNISFVDFTIQLRRVPTYYIINLIAPVILLSILNVFVFILPAESGERVGFSITCFLSFVVFLNIIMSFIPTASVNLAYLCYFTFIMMVFSCGMSLATVFTLWIHFKPEKSNVPVLLRGFIYILKYRCLPQRKQFVSKVSHVKTVDSIWDEDIKEFMDNNQINEDKPGFTVTWKDVASRLDTFFFLSFLAGQIFYAVGYLLPLILN